MRVTIPILVFIQVSTTLLLGKTTSAHTHLVPTEIPSIQGAIDTAATCDTILVLSGVYYETLDTKGKWLVIRSSGGAAVTTIDAQNLGTTVTLHGGGILEGFTIRNGHGEFAGGVYVWGEPGISGAIVGNIIASNTAGLFFDNGIGGGILIDQGVTGFEIKENTIRDNYAGDSGGGVFDMGSSTEICDNIIVGNGCHVTGGGVRLGGASLLGNFIADNWSDNHGGGVSGGGVLIENNTIVRNFHNNTLGTPAAGVRITGGQPTISHNIIALNYGVAGRSNGVGLFCADASPFGTPRLECNDIWGNDGGNIYFAANAPCDSAGGNNLSLDPLFCDEKGGNFSLAANSPCADVNNLMCGQIGAYSIQCGATSIQKISWGRLKALKRW